MRSSVRQRSWPTTASRRRSAVTALRRRWPERCCSSLAMPPALLPAPFLISTVDDTCAEAVMLELTADNTIAYLRERGWVGAEPVSVEPLGGGVSNAVLRVVTPERTFVLKQSRPQLRTRDAWFSDLARVYREQEVMQVLHPLLPAPTVPEVLFCDRANFVFALSHAPAGARVGKEALLAGEVDVTLGERAGVILGRMHETTARAPTLMEPFSDHTVFVQLRVDPFYRRVQERRPEVAGAVQP